MLHSICCPYCAQTIEIALDPSVASQTYIEDCQVCCRPMEIKYRFEARVRRPVVEVKTLDA